MKTAFLIDPAIKAGNMLFTLTSIIDFLGMGVSLWMALYLLGCGSPNRITIRGAIVLGAFAAFFLEDYLNLYKQVSEIVIIKAVLFVVSLSVWNDLIHKISSKPGRNHSWLVGTVYVFSFITILILLRPRSTFSMAANVTWVAQIQIQPTYILYDLFQLFVGASILYGTYTGTKLRVAVPSLSLWAASLLAVITIGYSVLASVLTSRIPSLVQNALLFSCMFALGIAVEHYQIRSERHTTLGDFAISSLAVFWLSTIYTFIAWRIGFSPTAMVLVAGLSILTHSSYNLLREFLERQRLKDENAFRSQLRQLENNVEQGMSLLECLQVGVGLLCQALESSGAFLALRDESQHVVVASHHSVPIGFTISIVEQEWKDTFPPPPEIANQVTWLVPATQQGELIALVGIGLPKGRLDYSRNSLNFLVETTNHLAMMICLRAHKPVEKDWLRQIITDAQLNEANIHPKSNPSIHTSTTSPDAQFVKIVEDGLRNLSDFITLGQSPLPGYLGISITNQIEKGKTVQQKLIQAIEVLRPAQDCPSSSIPREWHSYMILHDAYQNQIPNQDIMSKLYISEGTFHRTRRAAVRAVAQALLEMRKLPQN